MSKRPPDPRDVAIRVDSMFFDGAPGEPERVAADELTHLYRAREVLIAIPHSVRRELDRPATPAATQQRADEFSYTLDTGLGDPQRQQQAEAVLRGNAKEGAHEADAAHVYDSVCWAAGYFVTLDRRIHKKSEELRQLFPDLWVVRPTKLLEIYRDYIARDPRVSDD
jgi:hypothetical protein